MKRRLVMLALGGALLSAVALAPTAQAAVPRPSAEPSWCGWHPANDSLDPGRVAYSYVTIRDGQNTECTPIGGGYNADWVNIRCSTVNGGVEWLYIDDLNRGVTGWVVAASIYRGWDPNAC